MVDYSKWDKLDFSDDSDKDTSDLEDGQADAKVLQHMLDVEAPTATSLPLRPDPQTPWLGLAEPDTAADLPLWCRTPPSAFRPRRRTSTGEFGYWGLPDEDQDLEDIMRRLMSGVKYANADLDTPEAQYVKYLIDKKVALLRGLRPSAPAGGLLTLRAALVFRGDAGYRELEPSVWRQVRVGGGVRLRTLWEGLLRPAFGWARRYHAYLFRDGVDGATYGPSDCNTIDMMHLSMHGHAFIDDGSVRVADVLREKGDQVFVTYDLGDGWEHRVTVEEIEDPKATEESAVMELVDGANASPPEDSSGLQDKGCQAYQVFLDQGARCDWSGVSFRTACAGIAASAVNLRGQRPWHPRDFEVAECWQSVVEAQAQPNAEAVVAQPSGIEPSPAPVKEVSRPHADAADVEAVDALGLALDDERRDFLLGLMDPSNPNREKDMKLLWSKFPEFRADAIMGAVADDFGEPDEEFVAGKSGSECVAELQRQIEELRFDGCTALFMRRIRHRMEAGWEDETHTVGDIGVILHTTTRSAVTFRPNAVPVLEALGTLWRAPGVRRHLLYDNPLHGSAKLEIKAKFRHGLPHPTQLFPGEATVLSPYYALRSDPRGGHKPAYEYCFLYFNLLLGTALQGQPSMDSSRDGIGCFRTLPGPGTLTLTATRRVFELWCDKGVRDSVGDAMAPAASFARSYYDRVLRRALLRIQNPRTGTELRRTLAGLWRPCPAEVSIACFDEMSEGSWSYKYGAQLLRFLCTHTLEGRDSDFGPVMTPTPPPAKPRGGAIQTRRNVYDDLDVTPRVFFGWTQSPVPTLARLVAVLLHAVACPDDFSAPPFARRSVAEGGIDEKEEEDPRDLALRLFDGALAPAHRRLAVFAYLEETFDAAEAILPARARAFCARLLRRHRDHPGDIMEVDLRREVARSFTPPPRGAGVDPILARLQKSCLEKHVAALRKQCGGKLSGKRGKRARRVGKR